MMAHPLQTRESRAPAASAPPSRLVAGALVALVGGCTSFGGTPPAVAIETRLGTVRADDSATAREAADAYLELAATLADLAPDLQTPAVDVWVQDQVRSASLARSYSDRLGGLTLSHGSGGAYRIEVERDRLEEHLSHELVHAMLGPSWATLPAALEEGLCDSLSMDVTDRSTRRLSLLAGAARLEVLDATFLFRVRQDGGEWEDRSYDALVEYTPDRPDTSDLGLGEILALRDLHGGRIADTARIYAVGFTVVQLVRERVGVAGLHDLCVRAGAQGLRSVPAAWILTAAGVRGEADLRSRAERMVAGDAAAVLAWLATPQRGSLVRDLRARSGFETDDADAFFRLVQPRIQLLDGPMFALAELPGLVDWAQSSWGELAP